MYFKTNALILKFYIYHITGYKSYERVVLKSVIRAIYYAVVIIQGWETAISNWYKIYLLEYVSFTSDRSIPEELLLHYQNWLWCDRQTTSVKAPLLITSVLSTTES